MRQEDPCSSAFSAHVCYVGEVPVVEVSGEIDMSTVPELRSAIEEAVGQMEGASNLVVDLGGAGFMESMGLGLLIDQRQRLREHEGELKLVLGEGGAGEILRVTELESTFAIYPDLETAVGDSGRDK